MIKKIAVLLVALCIQISWIYAEKERSFDLSDAIELSDKIVPVFFSSLEKKNFTKFRKFISKEFNDLYTDEQLYEAFKEFHSLENYLKNTKKEELFYSHAHADEKTGEITVNAHYEGVIPENRLLIFMEYETSEETLKLISINMNTKRIISKITGTKLMTIDEAEKRSQGIITILSADMSIKDFKQFYKLTSKSFQAINSYEKVEKMILENLIPHDFGISDLESIELLRDPIINSEGNNLVNGSYLTNKGRKTFEFEFVDEEEKKRLQSFKFFDASELPSKNELDKLVKNIIFAFNDGARKEKFNVFYSRWLSEAFKKTYKLDDFHNAFKIFIDKKIDMKWIKGKDISYDNLPILNQDGSFTVTGRIIDEDNIVTFNMDIVNEKNKKKVNFLRLFSK